MLNTLITVLFLLLMPVANAAIDLDEGEPPVDLSLLNEQIKTIMNKGDAVSVEQRTGKLLFNPNMRVLAQKPVKQSFVLPAMLVDQRQGLNLVAQLPLSCFMVDALELEGELYKDSRQYSTLRYIRDAKQFRVSKTMLCRPIGKTSAKWQQLLELDNELEPYVFSEHVSGQGEHFFYYLNTDGDFEVYM